MALSTPTKPSKITAVELIDDREGSHSPKTVGDDDDDLSLEESRNLFVGDVDLREGQ